MAWAAVYAATSHTSSRREKYEPRARRKWRPQTYNLIGQLDCGRSLGVARTIWWALFGITSHLAANTFRPTLFAFSRETPSFLSMVSFVSCYKWLLSYCKLILNVCSKPAYLYLTLTATTLSHLHDFILNIFSFFSLASHYTANPAY